MLYPDRMILGLNCATIVQNHLKNMTYDDDNLKIGLNLKIHLFESSQKSPFEIFLVSLVVKSYWAMFL